MPSARNMPQTFRPTKVGGARRMRMADSVQRLGIRHFAGGHR